MADLKKLFDSATAFVATNGGNLDKTSQLTFYGLYKHVTAGSYNGSLFHASLDLKANAWNSRRNLTKEAAMEAYIEATEKLNLGWTKETYDQHTAVTGTFGLRPSVMVVEQPKLDTPAACLRHAIREGNLDSVKELMQKHPGIGKTLGDDTPVHLAADANQPALIYHFVEAGYSVNSRDKDLQTPLHIAAVCEYPDCVAILLELGANIELKNDENQAPKDFKLVNKLTEIFGGSSENIPE